MNEMVNADYRIVQERTLSVIVSEILTIEHNVAKVALDGAIEIGNRLKEAKEQIEHGEWEKWCQENLNYSKRQAERFMKISTEYGDENSPYSKATTLSFLSVSNALQLLQVPEEHVEEFVENHEIDNMTVKELNAEIDNLKVKLAEEEKKHLEDLKNRSDDEEEMEELEAKVEEFEMEVEDLKAKIETLEAAETEADNSEELEALQTKLEAAEAAADKQKEKLEAEIKGLKEKAEAEAEQKEREIKERIEEANRKAREQAKAESREPELEAEIENLKRKLENSSDENKVRFKFLVDDLQETWKRCVEASKADDSGKMIRALGIVLESMKVTIE